MPQHNVSTKCTVQRRSGDFCDAPSAEDVPFPICGKHASELYRHVRQEMGSFAHDPLFVMWHGFVEKPEWQREQEAQKRREKIQQPPVVYYLQVGQHVKIGVTTNLKQRLASYAPNRRLLATEPGGWDVERDRLLQFSDLLDMGNEWFRPGEKLIEHINGIRAKAGATLIRKFV